ncbi:nuclear pore membrane glycoprotein 210 isoform X1 [Harmonia axyridis]|uniref:nuclear pore membrane glycoprotein 210 isoform X1 n=1 Tax=Harmonia axyridis TaxID=115357 RepID=UPI001E27969E|nr:nuclear pore membrane glycoprotein 210 isoform X1 [Harmonia axyridis]
MGIIRETSILTIIFCIVLAYTFVESSKLNVPRVLLPIFKDFNPNFTLEATEEDDSCFKWKTTLPEALKLIPLEEDPFLKCSKKIIVTATGKVSVKTIAIVIAEDINSDNSLRCVVTFDHITSLSVVSKTRELYLTEAPEVFEIRALDSQGNEFSSLQGVEFNWRIQTMGRVKDAEIIRCLPFSVYDYEAPDDITQLEAQNKKGNMAVLEGVQTGAANVIVTLSYVEYAFLAPLEVPMTVAANIILQPSEVFLMAGDYIQYTVHIIKNGEMEQIPLPSQNQKYQIDTRDYKVAKVSRTHGLVYAMDLGTTEVYLIDKNLPSTDDSFLKPPSAVVHVVVPYHMTLAVLPYRNWNVFIGEKHDVVAEVFTKTEHKLTLGLGVQVDMLFSSHFQVEEKSKNGTWISGWCAKKGVAIIDATLQTVANPVYGSFKMDRPIQSRGEMMIFPRIKITPPEVMLPWDESVKPKFDIDLVAKGGDGKYLWSTSDHTRGVVSQHGHVRTLGDGSFEISAAMMRNHHNRETVKFGILRPAKLEIIEHDMEVEVGYPIHIHIALYADKPLTELERGVYIPFTRCQELPFKLKLSNDRFRQNRSDIIEPVGVSCANMALVGFSHGSTKVTISYMVNGKLLEDSATIYAYKPIKLEQPTADVVLAVGSLGRLVFTGGPQPVLSKPMEHYRVVTTSNPEIASVKDITNPHSMLIEDFTVIKVICLKLGETDLLLKISNSPIMPNCGTSPGSASVKIYCSKPRSIQLTPEIQVVDVHTCPLDITAENVMVQSNRDIELDVIVLDHMGRRFLNISSFLFDWRVDSNAELGTMAVYLRPHTFGSVLIPHRSYQVVKPKIDKGTIDVSASIKSYNMSYLEPLGIIPEWPEFMTQDDRLNDALPPISTKLQLTLVEDITLSPNESTLYNNPGNKEMIDILHGSGYYQLHLSSDSIARVKYLEKTHQIEIVPVETGELIVQVVDLCLPTAPVTAVINIIAVGIIRVEMSDKIEVGKCIHSTVRLYDEHDNLIMLESISIIALNYMQTKEIVTLQRLLYDEGESWPPGEVHYLVTGIEVGKTKLTFLVNNGFLEVQSAPIEIQVFEPLEIYPKNGSLLVGSSIQITTRGGPIPHLSLEYIVEPSDIATVTNKGIITGKAVGETKINCKSIGLHPTTGKKVVYSEDKTSLRVIILPSIKISAPLSRFKVGAEVPLWISGIPESLSPMVLGTVADPAIQFDWYLEDQQIAKLEYQFEEVGILYKKQDRIAVKLTGLVPGRTKVILNATLPGNSTDLDGKSFVMFSTFMDIEVFDDLKLTVPNRFIKSWILIAPHSHLRLETNFDDTPSISYKLQGQFSMKERILEKEKEIIAFNGIVGLSKTGNIVTYDSLGTSLIIVTARDEYGLKQELLIIVEVKEVHYMMFEVKSDWYSPATKNLRYLPGGVEFELQAAYYDNIGNKFDAGPVNVQIRNSRCDLVRVKTGSTNSSVHISTKKLGHTVLKMWADGIKNTAFYVKLHVELCIKPTLTHLTRGDIVCLFSPLVSRGYHGHWLSSDKTLVSFIDGAEDIAIVSGNREGMVVLTNSLHPSAPKHLQVLPVRDIVLTPAEQGTIITNSEVNTVFRTHVVLHSELSVDIKFSNLIAGFPCHDHVSKMITDYPFSCHIAFTNRSKTIKANDLFKVRSIFLPSTGQYACEVMSLGKNQSEASVLETAVYIFAMSLDDPDIVSHKLKVPFLPGVWAPSEINLNENGIGQLSITGLPKILNELMVFPSDSSILYVSNGKTDGYRVIHDIQVLDYHWRLADVSDAMSIIIVSRLTNQTFPVLVKVKSGFSMGEACLAKQAPIMAFLHKYRHSLAIICSMLVIFFTSFYAYSRYLQPVVNVNLVEGRSMSTGRTASPSCAAIGNYSINTNSAHPPNCPCTPCAGRNEPVYGDVSTFYNTSPEIRRNRRFL